ncbi:glycosyl hydrolase [Paenibacillaceae bacterium]|nr:glycosyl hydrolase [Paenibacillaceae bacterium]
MEQNDFSSIWAKLPAKVNQMIAQIGSKSPHVAGQDGVYDDARADWWTSGFWPGLLWIMHDMTGEEHYKQAAWDWDARLEQLLIAPQMGLHHDVGFQFLATAVIKHQITGDEDGKRRGLEAANYLAGRFNPAGNFIRAWNGNLPGWAIIDCMMNISLLFWATKQTNDPRYKHIAIRHADTAMEHFVREDGSVCHIVSFDPETGEFIASLGGQGNGPASAWSRGAAWALYGFANTFNYTGDIRYLDTAKRVAHFFLAGLPEDAVPYWDFRLDSREGEPRDSSAAAIAASGLLTIAELVPEQEKPLYVESAKRIIRSLSASYSTLADETHEAILLHGTGHRPQSQNVDVSLIYGDYFYIEALAKLNGWQRRIF